MAGDQTGSLLDPVAAKIKFHGRTGILSQSAPVLQLQQQHSLNATSLLTSGSGMREELTCHNRQQALGQQAGGNAAET